MRSRVMPGSSVTIARRVPVRRLKSVDLPTLGRPTITRDGSFSAMDRFQGTQRGILRCNADFQCNSKRGEVASWSCEKWLWGRTGKGRPEARRVREIAL